MTTAQLTPRTNQTPAAVSISNEPSGAQWVSRYRGSSSTNDLTPAFRDSVNSFIVAMDAAGMQYHIDATYRPPERSYLMHWAWMIKHGTDPASVPSMSGVNIDWAHSTREASVLAARQMATGFGLDNLRIAPALHSLHNEREAIDITISWNGNVDIKDADGNTVHIDTEPRNGMNAKLKDVGKTYRVKKFVGGDSDKPHWSTTGH